MKLLRDEAFQELLVNYPRPPANLRASPTSTEDTVSSEWLIRGRRRQGVQAGGLPDSLRAVRAGERRTTIEAIRILLDRPQDWSTTALAELRDEAGGDPQRFTDENLRQAHEVALPQGARGHHLDGQARRRRAAAAAHRRASASSRPSQR